MAALKRNVANNNTTGVARPKETSVAKIATMTARDFCNDQQSPQSR